MKRNITITVVVCIAFSVVVLLGFMHRLSQPRILNEHEMREYGAMMLDVPRRFSEFELTDHRGEPFTKADFVGKWTLIFFGFTHCPDICPTTMATLNKVIQPLEEDEKEGIQVVLLSVDPQRDTPPKLGEYVTYFNPGFIGLTGQPAQVLSLATQLGVVYTRVPLEGDDYTVDHSGNVIVINPMGDYHGFFRPPFEEGSVRVALRSMISRFEH